MSAARLDLSITWDEFDPDAPNSGALALMSATGIEREHILFALLGVIEAERTADARDQIASSGMPLAGDVLEAVSSLNGRLAVIDMALHADYGSATISR